MNEYGQKVLEKYKIMKKFAKEFLRKIVNAENYEIYVIP